MRKLPSPRFYLIPNVSYQYSLGECVSISKGLHRTVYDKQNIAAIREIKRKWPAGKISWARLKCQDHL